MNLLFWKRPEPIPAETPQETMAWANLAQQRRVPEELLRDAGYLVPVYSPLNGQVEYYLYRTPADEFIDRRRMERWHESREMGAASE